MVPFEELFDKIIGHETLILHTETQHTNLIPPTTNFAKLSSFFQIFQTKQFHICTMLTPNSSFYQSTTSILYSIN